MRTFLMTLSICLLLVAIPAVAQISIGTNTYQPAVGTVIRTFTDTSVTAAFYDSIANSAGGSRVWDFTGHSFTQESDAQVVSLASAPEADSFPGANFVLLSTSGDSTEMDTAWSFSSSMPLAYSTLGSVSRTGFGTQVIVFQNATPEIVFPINDGSQWTSQRDWSITELTNRSDIFDTTTNTVDGWGMVKYGTTEMNVLRVHSIKRMTTRLYVGGSLLDSTLIVTDAYNFIAPGSFSVVSVSKTTLGGTTFYGASASADFLGIPTDVTEDHPGSVPTGFSIAQNYPNPFNPVTTIRFSVPIRSTVKLAVYNLIGQEIKVLVERPLSAGSYMATWDGTNRAGIEVASGVYFYRIQAGSFTDSRRMVLLK